MPNLPQVVEPAVPAAPPRFGLEASARLVNTADRWEDGVKWQPEACGAGGAILLDGACVTLDEVAGDDVPGEETSSPFLVYAGEVCSTFGWRSRDWLGRARRQLVATRSYRIAAELWAGALGTTGLHLTDPTSDALTTSPLEPLEALAVIEAGLAYYLKGRQGMVHVTPQVLTHLVGANVARLEGITFMSPSGHLIVGDAGYPGTGPTNRNANFATQWAYGTAVVALRLGTIVTNPGDPTTDPGIALALTRATNDVEVVAEQTVLYQVDACAHVAAEIAVPVPAIGGAS